MEKLNVIREKCIEANPSIQDLKFGCLIKYHLGRLGDFRVDYEGIVCQEIEDAVMIPGFNSWINKKACIKKIIGRPIRLADVLLALKDVLMSVSVTNKVDYGKASFILEPVGSMKHFMWDLKQDDLSKQSEETIDFIYSLLS